MNKTFYIVAEESFHHSTKAIPLRTCKMTLMARPTVQSWNLKNGKFRLGLGALFTFHTEEDKLQVSDSKEMCESSKCEQAIVLTQPKPPECQPW